MADIDIQEKRGGSGWIWILGVVLLALVVWWFWPDQELDQTAADLETLPVAEEPAVPEPVTQAPAATIADIMANPAAYVGQPFPGGEVRVAEVPTDRGFWIEAEGQRLFALVIDQPQEQPVDINPGQTLQLTEGMLRDASYLPQLEGAALDDATRRIIEQLSAYLVVPESAMTIR